jgi:hypothetical protein
MVLFLSVTTFFLFLSLPSCWLDCFGKDANHIVSTKVDIFWNIMEKENQQKIDHHRTIKMTTTE